MGSLTHSNYSRRIEAAWVYPKADNWGLEQWRVSLDKLDATAPLGEFIDQEHLMDIVASQAIRGCDQDAFNDCHGDAISQPVEPRSLESGAAVSVVAVDVLVGDMPIGVRGDSVTETAKLLVNRLVLLLTGR